MSFKEAVEAKVNFRLWQRERRAQGGLRRRRVQRRDDDKPETAEDGGETPSEDDSPSEDESSTKFTQVQTQTSTSSQRTQESLSTTSTSSSIQAFPTASTTLQSLTSVRTSVAISTSSASQSPRTTSAATTSLSSPLSKSSSSIITSSPAFSTPLAASDLPKFVSSSSPSPIKLQTSTSSSTSVIAAAETAGSGISSKQSSDPNKQDHSTAIIFGTVGAFAGIFALLAIVFFIRSKYLKPKAPKPTANEQEARAYAARSIWGAGSTITSASGDNSQTTMAQFVPPLTLPSLQPQQGNPNTVGAAGNDAVDRQERLQRVRLDILGDREMKLGTGMGAIKQPARAWGAGKFQRLNEGGDGDVGGNEGGWERPRVVDERGSRAMTEDSLPRWRDPETWARDQTRRNEGRGDGNL